MAVIEHYICLGSHVELNPNAIRDGLQFLRCALRIILSMFLRNVRAVEFRSSSENSSFSLELRFCHRIKIRDNRHRLLLLTQDVGLVHGIMWHRACRVVQCRTLKEPLLCSLPSYHQIIELHSYSS
ncbi:hypothetical protein KC19_10G077500 [Ceratodon purpureus]|uniref:Uncharacterized protein n=1 Tax=Ceratodon purpureus TaxID=3225 RepID=A0A8T0GI47_CERPU|nr:hypothetical protein KC19_10G077500 [Ceratodon purpureus]